MGIIQTATTVKKVDNTKGLKAGLCGLGGLAFAGCACQRCVGACC